MKKKIILLFLLFGFIDLIIISCCPNAVAHTTINSLEIVNTDMGSELENGNMVDSENFNIKLKWQQGYVASNFSKLSPLNSAYANSCLEDGYAGLKSEIKSFEITCNESILGIESGMPLNIENNIYVDVDVMGSTGLTLEYWIGSLNRGLFRDISHDFYFRFARPIETDKPLIFYFTIELENGFTYNLATQSILIN
jgi:hypothetical protein